MSKKRRTHKECLQCIESIKSLKQMTETQCSDGNANHDPIMHGMANGMIFALSLFEAGTPDYLEAPEVWLCDLPQPEKISASSVKG